MDVACIYAGEQSQESRASVIHVMRLQIWILLWKRLRDAWYAQRKQSSSFFSPHNHKLIVFFSFLFPCGLQCHKVVGSKMASQWNSGEEISQAVKFSMCNLSAISRIFHLNWTFHWVNLHKDQIRTFDHIYYSSRYWRKYFFSAFLWAQVLFSLFTIIEQ